MTGVQTCALPIYTEPQPSRREQASDPRQGNGVKRKSKNFLLDDDEFEFEFLNMDGKDL